MRRVPDGLHNTSYGVEDSMWDLTHSIFDIVPARYEGRFTGVSSAMDMLLRRSLGGRYWGSLSLASVILRVLQV